MSRRFQNMHITRDEWSAGDWIAVSFSLFIINCGLVLMVAAISSVLHIHWF